MNNTIKNGNTHFTLSHDVLKLIKWIIEHESSKLEKLVIKAVQNGFTRYDDNHPTIGKEEMHELHMSITDFFGSLELFLYDALRNQTHQRAREKQLLKSIDYIDQSICNSTVIQSSLETTTKKHADAPMADQQQLLFQEILKRWTPGKKAVN